MIWSFHWRYKEQFYGIARKFSKVGQRWSLISGGSKPKDKKLWLVEENIESGGVGTGSRQISSAFMKNVTSVLQKQATTVSCVETKYYQWVMIDNVTSTINTTFSSKSVLKKWFFLPSVSSASVMTSPLCLATNPDKHSNSRWLYVNDLASVHC